MEGVVAHARECKDVKATRFPELMVVSITSLCNQRCIICYRFSVFNKSGRNFNIKEIISLLQECEEKGLRYVTFDGGEPFLHPELPELVATLCETTNLRIGIVTNGTIIREEVLKKISDFHERVTLEVSVHGGKEVDNWFRGVERDMHALSFKFIETCNSYGIVPGVAFVVSRYTKVEEIVRDVRNKGLSISFLDLQRAAVTKENVERIRKYFMLSVKEWEKIILSFVHICEKEGINALFSDAFPCDVFSGDVKKVVENSCSFCPFGFSAIRVNMDERKAISICPCADTTIFSSTRLTADDIEVVWRESEVLKEFRSLDWLRNVCKRPERNVGCYRSNPKVVGKHFYIDYLLEET
jgi:MoaA/NifB/PqqE/SkfB family radical SAM enzyme